MSFVFNLMSEQSVIAFVQFLLGSWIKGNPKIQNSLIPVATFLVGVLGFLVAPASAHAASVLAPAAPIAGVFAAALGQMLFVTGSHSTWKNTVFPALRTTLAWLASSLNKTS